MYQATISLPGELFSDGCALFFAAVNCSRMCCPESTAMLTSDVSTDRDDAGEASPKTKLERTGSLQSVGGQSGAVVS